MAEAKAASPAVLTEAQRAVEKLFVRNLSKSGWRTYRDESTGRVVTNAYEDEKFKVERFCGMPCQVVARPFAEGFCVQIGPRF